MTRTDALGAGARPVSYACAVHLGLIAVVVSEYDPAISFFVDGLGFELVEDSPALTNNGRPKRWVVVRPPGAATGLLLARAHGEDQAAAVGTQTAGRVGFFLYVEDFRAAYTPTPAPLGVSILSRRLGSGVPCVLRCLFDWCGRAWRQPACRGGSDARFHGPRAEIFLLPAAVTWRGFRSGRARTR